MCVRSKLYWISTESSGWSVDYKNVLLHAISKPDESRPYIYLQFGLTKIIDPHGQEISFSDGNEDEEKFVEVNLFVKDNEVGDEMFVALSECASLHPCDDESEDERENETETDGERNKRIKIELERFEDAAEN